jgi:transmembrane sensor
LKEEKGSYQSAATNVGQREIVRLADGSVITLNTASNLRYRLDDGRRSIMLDRGEAFFQVAKDPTRPFVVTLATGTVTAVGTAFNIKVIPSTTEVTVTQGVVAFDPLKNRRDSPYRLAAGDFAKLADGNLDIRRGAQTGSATAWTQGQLVYENRTLRDVVEDLDRYFTGQLVVDRGKAASFRVSAVVNLTSEDDVLRSLASQLPIDVERLPNGDRRISVRDAEAHGE